MLQRFALPLLLGLLVGAAPCAAQDKEPAKHSGKDSPGGFPRKDPSTKPAATAGKPTAGAEMDVRPAPKTGSMPGKNTPAPQGRLGTEPTRQGKLGTPPLENSKDRPPRPQ
jgi:hypothetical protein